MSPWCADRNCQKSFCVARFRTQNNLEALSVIRDAGPGLSAFDRKALKRNPLGDFARNPAKESSERRFCGSPELSFSIYTANLPPKDFINEGPANWYVWGSHSDFLCNELSLGNFQSNKNFFVFLLSFLYRIGLRKQLIAFLFSDNWTNFWLPNADDWLIGSRDGSLAASARRFELEVIVGHFKASRQEGWSLARSVWLFFRSRNRASSINWKAHKTTPDTRFQLS